jgi:hypothetical protein
MISDTGNGNHILLRKVPNGVIQDAPFNIEIVYLNEFDEIITEHETVTVQLQVQSANAKNDALTGGWVQYDLKFGGNLRAELEVRR